MKFIILTDPWETETLHIKGRVPRNGLNQTGRELRGSEDLCARALVGVQGGVQGGGYSKRLERMSLMHLNVSWSQSWDVKKGKLWQGQSYHIGAPGLDAQLICGDVEEIGKHKTFKIIQYIND